MGKGLVAGLGTLYIADFSVFVQIKGVLDDLENWRLTDFNFADTDPAQHELLEGH